MNESRWGQALMAAAAATVAVLVAVTLLVQGVLHVVNTNPASAAARALTEAFTADATSCDSDGADLLQSLTSRSEIAELAGRFDAEQLGNARTIVRVGQSLNVPARGWVIAVAAAIQESSLRNLRHGDAAGRDSRGLFQQRAAWGPLKARMDQERSADMFFTGGQDGQPGLLDIRGWDSRLSLAEAAQAVQRSRHPHAYAAHVQEALALVLTITTRDPQGDSSTAPAAGILTGCPGGGKSAAVNTAIAFAQSQLGQPYLWGGDGPANGENGFDCSGLTSAAYRAAGITLARTAQEQYRQGPPVPVGDLQAGDLVFFGTSTDTITHVGLYIGGNRMIDAPHTGAVVRIEDHRWSSLIAATRPSATTPTAARR
ncbi:lipoprotein [Kineosporia sp. NBRC 101677]|uniref:C40 family peptidase n=1 Tax=Kineosporia sp. NBRC 101677 TaxID=3032197 RepID=UPI0024A5B1AC|nr:C40 family peptidase [Kineosporia sp. NBRC 101677]GLY20028.1 lipoprotein [Kineosporia sp. NBRC 101677]